LFFLYTEIGKLLFDGWNYYSHLFLIYIADSNIDRYVMVLTMKRNDLMQIKLPDIFEYIDFRRYLADYRAVKKAIDPGFTHAYICHKLGNPNTRGYLDNIIKGRKLLTSPFVDRMAELLQLSPSETKYFRALVHYNQTMIPQEKEFFFDQIVQLNKAPRKFIDAKSYAFYREWYHNTIYALLDIYDFRDEYSVIAKKLKPHITVTQAKNSIELLRRLELIAPDEKGFLKPTSKVLSTGECVKDHIIRQYQLQCLERGKEAIILEDDDPRKTSTFTVSVSSKGFQHIVTRLQQFKSEIRSIVHQDSDRAQKVYQINLQIFPNSR
jgi:uncharacterized protein (TIGR02147 family)